MANTYHIDLRKRAIALYESGKEQKEVCELLNISLRTLYNWMCLKERKGDISPKPRTGPRSSRKITPEGLTAYFEKHPDAFLKEAAAHFKVWPNAVRMACIKFGITRKKNDPLQRALRGKKASIRSGNSKSTS